MPSDAPAKRPRDALVMPSPAVGFQTHVPESSWDIQGTPPHFIADQASALRHRWSTVAVIPKAHQEAEKNVPTLSLALYPSERAIKIGRFLFEPSLTVVRLHPSREAHQAK